MLNCAVLLWTLKMDLMKTAKEKGHFRTCVVSSGPGEFREMASSPGLCAPGCVVSVCPAPLLTAIPASGPPRETVSWPSLETIAGGWLEFKVACKHGVRTLWALYLAPQSRPIGHPGAFCMNTRALGTTPEREGRSLLMGKAGMTCCTLLPSYIWWKTQSSCVPTVRNTLPRP